MDNKLVSVIMPVYNGQDFVSRCIDSIIYQTYKNLEIILVDDGSTDNSSKILDDYEKEDTRIKVIHQKNKGLSGARNAGLDICTGDYITFIDADDFYHYKFVELTVGLCEKHNADITQANYDVGFLSDFSKTDNSDEEIIIFENNKIFESNKYKTVAWSKMYKRFIFDDIRYPANNVIEDEATTYKTFYHANKVIYTSQKLYYAFMSKGSITRAAKEYDMRFMDVFEDRLEFFKQKNERLLYDISIVKYTLALSIRYMRMYCGKINTKQQLSIVKKRFDELYITAATSKYISKKHKLVIKVFKILPKLTAIFDDYITRIRRKCGSY